MLEPCHNNRPSPAVGYYATNRRYLPDGRWVLDPVWIPNTMSKECGQPGAGLPPAPGCVGCKHLKDEK